MFSLIARIARKFRRHRRGAFSVEYAFVALPFLVLLFGIIESGFMLFNAVIIEGAAQEAARQVRTGVVQNAVDPENTFKTLLCDNLWGMVPCNNLTYLVETFPNFQASGLTDMFDANGNPINPTYANTEPGDIVIVRVATVWAFMTPLIGYFYGTDSLKLVSTVVFRNEPFSPPGS
jgi:Flp pilus assembly protein TadG